MTASVEEMTAYVKETRKQILLTLVIMGIKSRSMMNLSEKKSGFENAINKLREMTLHVGEITSRIKEILSRVRVITSGTEEIKPTISPVPDSIIEIPGQASSTIVETNPGESEPGQSRHIPFN